MKKKKRNYLKDMGEKESLLIKEPDIPKLFLVHVLPLNPLEFKTVIAFTKGLEYFPQ